MSASDAMHAELIEVIDLTSSTPRRCHELAPTGLPSTLSLIAQHPRSVPATVAADVAQARKRALVGLYADERA